MAKFNSVTFYNKKQVAICDSVLSANVASASTQKITSVLIPANTFVAGDIIHIEYVLTLSNTSNSSTHFLYWNNTDDLTTPIQLTTRQYTNFNNITHNRRLSVIVANGTGSGTLLYNTATNLESDFAAITAAMSNVALDWTSDSYIILAGFAGVSTNISSRYLKVTN